MVSLWGEFAFYLYGQKLFWSFLLEMNLSSYKIKNFKQPLTRLITLLRLMRSNNFLKSLLICFPLNVLTHMFRAAKGQPPSFIDQKQIHITQMGQHLPAYFGFRSLGSNKYAFCFPATLSAQLVAKSTAKLNQITSMVF